MGQELKDLPREALEEIVKQFMVQKGVDDSAPKIALKVGEALLLDKVKAFLNVGNKFEPIKRGDIVKWKKGLKNKKVPDEEQCAVVVDIVKESNLQGDRDSGSPYYREPLDLALAVLDKNGDLVVYHYDQRRFEKVKDGLDLKDDSASEEKASQSNPS